MTGLSQLARQHLSTTLARVGPDAPTLCEGWNTRDLAVHLVVRERRPDTVASRVVPALADHTKSVHDSYRELPWEELIDLFRQGPRGWSPTRVPSVDDAVNLVEFYVHHQDVQRADPAWDLALATDQGPEIQEALWARLKQMGQLLFRRAPVGIVLRPEGIADTNPKAVHGPTKLGTITISGRPSELILYGYGRRDAASVRINGEPDAVAAAEKARFSV